MGKVILAGAGPGDPELLTIKAAKYLQQADTVISDRLVSKDILSRYVRPDAEVIIAGKEGHKQCSIRQSEINNLILEYYQPGRLLVRLKGGDTAFFSNILDELNTLHTHHIPYEIVPGITAASGASAYCGIPLTARGFANSVRFITHYRKDNRPESYWQELAHTEDTLVCYMSGEQLLYMLHKLHDHGMSNEKSVAVIEQATTPMQKTIIYEIKDLPYIQHNFKSPTLIIIGKVVTLYHSFQWKENSILDGPYFEHQTKPECLPHLIC